VLFCAIKPDASRSHGVNFSMDIAQIRATGEGALETVLMLGVRDRVLLRSGISRLLAGICVEDAVNSRKAFDSICTFLVFLQHACIEAIMRNSEG
jgi:hypothetical protein